jgi:tetraacyldisaccharide-1-P 4'-kinase
VIVRILGDRLYEVPEADLSEIEQLDEKLTTAMNAGDEPAFSDALSQLIAKVREACAPLGDDDDRKSDIVIPHDGSSLQEVRDMLDAGV